MNEKSTEAALSEAYGLMETGRFYDAMSLLFEALEFDQTNIELDFAYWCCRFWAPQAGAAAELPAAERGAELFSFWVTYTEALERSSRDSSVEKTQLERLRPEENPRSVYATKRGAFSLALEAYTEVENQMHGDQNVTVAFKADVLRRIGVCHKELGNYDAALSYLKDKANALTPRSAAIFAEMADCLALMGNEREAKLYFREAFFIDAQKVELAFLDSELILSVVKMLRPKGFTRSELLEWIPVYAEITHVFSMKHEIKAQEVNRLVTDVFAREKEMKDPSNSQQTLTPKLINMYFWLIDHYERSRDAGAPEKSREYQLKIRSLNEEVYSLYTAAKAL